jgi:ankyrin repeat protein
LHYAAFLCAPDDIIKALIDAGADPKAIDKDGKTPADLARDKKHLATASLIEQYGMAPTKSANLMV